MAEEAGPAPGGPGLRLLLLGLVAAIALPFLAFVAWTLADGAARERAHASEAVMATTRALAARLDREKTALEGLLRGLASSPAVTDGDYGSFANQVRDGGLPPGSHLALMEAEGRAILRGCL